MTGGSAPATSTPCDSCGKCRTKCWHIIEGFRLCDGCHFKGIQAMLKKLKLW